MADQRVTGSDLFVLNRIVNGVVNTYKTTASDIGIFLLQESQPPGSNPEDKYINDGPINVYGEIPGSSETFKNLHSANEYCEGKLVFKDGFLVTGAQHDVRIEHNFDFLSSNLACDGLDGSGTCLKLNMSWLSENIICSGTGSGLESLGDCIQLNLCGHGGLNIDPSDGCLEVSLCPFKGIVHSSHDGCLELDLSYLSNNLSCNGLRPSGGNANSLCMEIDMDWLSSNLRCGDVNDPTAQNGSGLIDGGGCIEVDPCWVSDKWNLGNNKPSLSPGDTNSIDVQGCRIAINHDWLLQWAKDNINDIEVDGLCITRSSNGNLFKNEVTIKQDVPCIREYVCDNNTTITFKQNTTEKVSYSPCQNNDKTLTAYKLTIKQKDEDGNLSELGIFEPFVANKTITVESTGGGSVTPPVGGTVNKILAGDGISVNNGGDLNTNNVTITAKLGADGGLEFDDKDGIIIGSEEDSCLKLGRVWAGGATFRTTGSGNRPAISMGAGATTDKDQTYLGISGESDDARLRLTWSNDWDGTKECGGTPTGGSKDLLLISRDENNGNASPRFKVTAMGAKPTAKANMRWVGSAIGGPNDPDSGSAAAGNIVWVDTSRGAYNSVVKTVDDDTNVASFNIDNIIDQIGGTGSTGILNDGLVKFYIDKDSEAGTVQGEIKEWPNVASPTIFLEDLAAVHPSLVTWTWSNDSMEEYEPHPGTQFGPVERLLPNPTAVPEDVNFDALTLVSLVGIRRLRNRIAELEAKTTREGTLNTLGIIEYTNETAAANSGLGQGEVYWDTTLGRMRAVT